MDTFLPNSRGCCFCRWYCSSCCGCAEQMLCLVVSILLPWTCICGSRIDHCIQPRHSAHQSPNPPSADYTAKPTWVRRSLHALPCFCRKLSLMAGPGGYTWMGLLVSSVCSVFWRSVFDNKALWKVVANKNCSRNQIGQVHFHELLKHSLLWG